MCVNAAYGFMEVDMYKTKIEDKNLLNTFLSLNETEYVDCLLKRGESVFISNSSNMFGILSVSTEASIGEEPLEFRFPVKILKNIVTEGYVLFELAGDNVVARIHNKDNKCIAMVSLQLQRIFTEAYNDKLESLAKMTQSAVKLSGKELREISRIGKVAKAIVTVDGGLCGINLAGRSRLFSVPEDDKLKQERFSIYSYSLSKLLSLSGTVYNFENYLCSAHAGLTIMATKCRGESNEDFYLLEEMGAKMKCDIELSTVMNFIKSMKLKVSEISLDVEKKFCEFTDSAVNYKIPFTVNGLVTSPSATLEPIILPIKVLEQVGSVVQLQFKLEQKRTALKLQSEKITLYV